MSTNHKRGGAPLEFTAIWSWLKKPVPKWNPGKWKHGPKPAVCPWLFNFEPHPYRAPMDFRDPRKEIHPHRHERRSRTWRRRRSLTRAPWRPLRAKISGWGRAGWGGGGVGLNLFHQEGQTAGFGPCVHLPGLPGFHFGTGFLSHSQIRKNPFGSPLKGAAYLRVSRSNKHPTKVV